MKLTTLLMLAFLTISCNSTSKNEHNTNDLNIELVEGEKWTVNEEMVPFIKEGENILNNYKGSDYKKLAMGIEDQNFALIKSCTMKGKSHDELHKWLHPHLELVNELKKAKNEKEANLIIEQLKTSYQTYKIYFK